MSQSTSDSASSDSEVGSSQVDSKRVDSKQADSNQVDHKSESASLARARGKARRLAMQAIYQWQMTGDSVAGIKKQFIEEHKLDDENKKIDGEYFSELLSGVSSSISTIDPLLEKYMSRLIESVDPVERAVLRLATYEFINRLDVPYKVVLNEAVNITKKFCAEKSHTFVNAVLDKVAKEIRSTETQSS